VEQILRILIMIHQYDLVVEQTILRIQSTTVHKDIRMYLAQVLWEETLLWIFGRFY